MRFLLGGGGDAHGVGLSDFRALCGFIKPVSKLFDWVEGHELTLFKALSTTPITTNA